MKKVCLIFGLMILIITTMMSNHPVEAAEKEISHSNRSEPICAVKLDPWCSHPIYGMSKENLKEQIKKWHEHGVNAVYVIVYNSGGHFCYRSQLDDAQRSRMDFNKHDILETLTEECPKYGIEVRGALWGLHDSYYPQWDQLNTDGKTIQEFAGSHMICPSEYGNDKRYLSSVFIPIMKEVRDRYGIKEFYIQEFRYGGGPPSCLCDYCREHFNSSYGYSFQNAHELLNAYGNDKEARKHYDTFHTETISLSAKKIKDVVPDSLIDWSGINYYLDFIHGKGFTNPPSANCFQDFYEMLGKGYIDRAGVMTLWDIEGAYDPKVAQAYISTVKALSREVGYPNRERMIIEFMGDSRFHTFDGLLFKNIFLAIRAGGMKHLVIEQDAWIEMDNYVNPELWSGVKYCYSGLTPWLQAWKGREGISWECKGDLGVASYQDKTGHTIIVVNLEQEEQAFELTLDNKQFDWGREKRIYDIQLNAREIAGIVAECESHNNRSVLKGTVGMNQVKVYHIGEKGSVPLFKKELVSERPERIPVRLDYNTSDRELTWLSGFVDWFKSSKVMYQGIPFTVKLSGENLAILKQIAPKGIIENVDKCIDSLYLLSAGGYVKDLGEPVVDVTIRYEDGSLESHPLEVREIGSVFYEGEGSPAFTFPSRDEQLGWGRCDYNIYFDVIQLQTSNKKVKSIEFQKRRPFELILVSITGKQPDNKWVDILK